jgi:superfamily II DNA helicase RecQ
VSVLLYSSVSLLGKLHRDILGELQEAAYFNREKYFENKLIGTFYAGLCSKNQKTIIQNFVKEESTIRLIICTVVFGLGVNIPDVRFVVHWGACDSALQYWQEVGRVGRDSKKAKAYMYATKSSIVHINDDMKNICNGVQNGTISCFRKAILNCMIPGSSESNIKQPCTLKYDLCECDQCFCCSICMATCPCNNK